MNMYWIMEVCNDLPCRGAGPRALGLGRPGDAVERQRETEGPGDHAGDCTACGELRSGVRCQRRSLSLVSPPSTVRRTARSNYSLT